MSHFWNVDDPRGFPDGEEPESGDEGSPTCKFCGRENLMWDTNHHDATGKWRLWEGEWPDGKPHTCNRTPAVKDFVPL